MTHKGYIIRMLSMGEYTKLIYDPKLQDGLGRVYHETRGKYFRATLQWIHGSICASYGDSDLRLGLVPEEDNEAWDVTWHPRPRDGSDAMCRVVEGRDGIYTAILSKRT